MARSTAQQNHHHRFPALAEVTLEPFWRRYLSPSKKTHPRPEGKPSKRTPAPPSPEDPDAPAEVWTMRFPSDEQDVPEGHGKE